MTRVDRIVVDRAPWVTRVAFLASGEVVELWVEGADRPSPIGAVALARVTAVHRELGAATIAIPGGEASLSDRSVVEGERLIVQIVADGVAAKRPVARAGIELSDGPVVLTPGMPGVGLSSSIRGKAKRAGLKAALAVEVPAECGVLVRAGGADRPAEDLVAAARRLLQRWRAIQEAARTGEPPRWLEPPASAIEAARGHAPGVEPEVDDGGRLFEDCGAADALEGALARRVGLPDGGELVIESVEAATLIDVNLPAGGRDGFRRANEAAALAAVRQVRLRGLRGTVLLDLPRMTDRAARSRVVQLVTEMTADDPSPVQVLGWTPGGMLELVRKGVRRPLADDLLEVPAEPPVSPRAAAWSALAGVRRELGRIARPRLSVAPAVARWLDGPGRPILEAERARLGYLEVVSDPALGRDAYRVESED
ncbi:ribonuclease G [Thalassobaculum fulvum]|uniref:Ribonuclease G n=1 Tax=Thalassobaculum fulvum TaxID=1633335 RepID=A0A919CSD4_9PROT|nr:ribonuclease E/G [Thalassobaculum fulvum]GHD61932.1 ribonuclease G [Thalassobaculum fulvum]